MSPREVVAYVNVNFMSEYKFFVCLYKFLIMTLCLFEYSNKS